MAHATRGGESVVDEGEMVKAVKAGHSAGSGGERAGDVIDSGGGKGTGRQGVGCEKGRDFVTELLKGFGKVDVVDQSLIDESAGGFREG